MACGSEGSGVPRDVGLEAFLAFNEEIMGLARSGLPIGLMLREGDWFGPRGLRRLRRGLADRLERGMTLEEAVEDPVLGLPRFYRMVVGAGIRSGRLPEVLERLARFAGDYLELRQSIWSALAYPLTVVAVAYGLFLGMVLVVLPRIAAASRDLGHGGGGLWDQVVQWGETAWIWGPVLPCVFLAVLGMYWWSSRASGLAAGRMSLLLGWVPGVRRIARHLRAGCFADCLGLLLSQGRPWPEAVRVAAEATQDRVYMRSAERLAEAVERGESIPSAAGSLEDGTISPLIRWMMVVGSMGGDLAESMQRAGELERRRAEIFTDRLRTHLPIWSLVFVGGSAALGYGMLLFGPWSRLLRLLGQE
jgi:general secretion pathway protein F